MKEMTVYLIPHSSFRGSHPPRSDTLFGAICWGYRLLYGNNELEQLLGKFSETSVPFLISSMFRYIEQEGKKDHIFPKPYTAPLDLLEGDSNPCLEELVAVKKLRKMREVHGQDFSDIVQGKKDNKAFYEEKLKEIREDRENKDNKHNKDKKSPLGNIKNFQRPHGAINRLTGSVEGSSFFYTEEFSLSLNTKGHQGLFFCVKCEDGLVKDLTPIFYFIGDKGIGGKASIGKGHIKDITIKDGFPYKEPEADESSHVVTLSLTFPDARLRGVLANSWYELEKRQGKIESMYSNPEHVWKDHLLMLKEGSTFPKNGQSFYGKNPVVREDDGKLGFNVQHYGYAFTVNTKHVKS